MELKKLRRINSTESVRNRRWPVIIAYLLIPVLLVVILESSLSFMANGAKIDIPADQRRMDFFNDSKNHVIVASCDDQQTVIQSTKLDTDKVITSTPYDFVCKVSNTVYFLRNTQADGDYSGKVLVSTYSMLKHKITSEYSFDGFVSKESDFAVMKGDKILNVGAKTRQSIYVNKSTSKKIFAHAFKRDIDCIKANASGSLLYVRFSDNGEIMVIDSNFKKIGVLGANIKGEYRFISDNVILDANGKVYLYIEGTGYDFEHKFNVDNMSEKGLCRLSGTQLIFVSRENEISALDLLSGEITVLENVSGETLYLSMCGDKISFVTQSEEGIFLKTMERTGVNREEDVVKEKNEDKSKPMINDDKKLVCDTKSNLEISSDIYELDFERRHIRDIDPETSVSEFKRNIEYEGYDVSLWKKDKAFKNSKIGTNTKVCFDQDGKTKYEFIAIVPGDLTGTGKVTTVDEKLMYKHIFNEETLQGAYFIAADFNGDGKVDTLDLLALRKSMK